jgi:hypothetical protein
MDLWVLIYKLSCSCYNGNLISIDDFAIEECEKKRDTDKQALSSLFKNIGACFDLHLSVFARADETEPGKNKFSITCFKIDKCLEISEERAAKRARTSAQPSANAQ